MFKSLFASSLFAVMFVLAGGTAFGARYVPVKVSVNGEVILEGNASDSGERDADEIWEALKVANLGETEAFKEFKIGPELKEYKFEFNPPAKGQAWPVQIDASFGGVAETRFVTIKRVPPDASGRSWRIVSEDLDRMFDSRMIVRSQAKYLKHPKYDKIEELVKQRARQAK